VKHFNLSGNSTVFLDDGAGNSQERVCWGNTQVDLGETQIETVFHSEECEADISGTFRIRSEEDARKTLSLFVFFGLVAGACVMAMKRQLEYLLAHEHEAGRLSITSLFLFIYQMIYISLYAIYLGITNVAGSAAGLGLVVLGSSYFIVGMGLSMRIVVMAWRASLANTEPQYIKRQVFLFYLRFYLGNVAFFMLMIRWGLEPLFLLLQGLFLLPQVAKNCYRGSGAGFYPYFYYGMLGPNMCVSIYLRSCPENVERMQPVSWFMLALVGLHALACTLLYLQHQHGPRFFVPRCLIPNYYEYSKQVAFDVDMGLL
jgi:hypothetical protein